MRMGIENRKNSFIYKRFKKYTKRNQRKESHYVALYLIARMSLVS